jgi:hypothetical protein
MMGERTVMQEALFYEFNLERHVPADHRLRPIDRFVDLSGIRAARRLRRRQRRRPPGTRSRYAIQSGAVRAGEWFIVSQYGLCGHLWGRCWESSGECRLHVRIAGSRPCT